MSQAAKPGPEKVNIQGIIDGLNEEYISARLESVLYQQANLVDMVRLKELIDIHGDFSVRVCPKSGAILQDLNTFQIMRLLDICPDEDYAITLLKKQNIANPALHWLYDDGVSLDKLMEIDPYGYFVYASSYVCSNHSPLAPEILRDRFAEHAAYEYEIPETGETIIRLHNLSGAEKERIKKLALFDWVMQKKFLREKIEQYPLAQIVRINETMRRYLSFFNAANLDKFDTYDMLMDETCPEILPAIARDLNSFELYLTSTLKQVVWHEVKTGRLSYGIDYDDVLKLHNRYQGLSNFFHQYQPNLTPSGPSKAEVLLDGFMKIANVPGEAIAYRERIERQLKEKRIIAVNRDNVICKPVTKAITFTFGKKPEPDKDIKL